MNKEAAIERDETLVVVDPARRRRLALIAAAAGAVVLMVVAFLLLRGGDERSSSGAANTAAGAGSGAGGQMQSVSVIVPGRAQAARTITASGALAARRDQPVGVAGEGGLVTAVLVDAGSWVRQGQTLAVIERSVQSQEAAQLAAQVAAAQAEAALAQNELDRAQALVGRGFISRATVDQKRAARDAAAARVRVAQAQLGATRARIRRLDIRAPTSGLVLARSVEVGQVVGPGSGALFRLARDGAMEMRARVPQHDLAAIRVGFPATVTPLGSERSFAGSVWQVSPVIDPASRQGEARIALAFDPAIRPGGFAQAEIHAGAITAPILPQSAIMTDDKGTYVYVVNQRNQVERRAVETGEVTEAGVAVIAGLAGTERVVQSAGPFLNPGQRVAPRRAAAR